MIYDRIAREGWPAFKMTYPDALALEACILEAGDGDYLEIGVRMGGSAIFAGLVKKAVRQEGKVYGIDNMGSGMAAKGVTPEAVIGRAKRYGAEIDLTIANSNPWPLPESVRPVVALVDGGHAYEDVLADWHNLRDRAKRFILFHDYRPEKKVCYVTPVVEMAKGDPAWRFVGQSGWMAVFECVSS